MDTKLYVPSATRIVSPETAELTAVQISSTVSTIAEKWQFAQNAKKLSAIAA
jgi:hypothetical protein